MARARWGIENEGMRELKDPLAPGCRRVRSRRNVEPTDRGLAQRLQRALLEVSEPLGPTRHPP